jgi:5-methyltetrahydropteroyltriglutamate--homocysteine methyltransferase
VVDVHVNSIEDPSLIKDRAITAAKIVDADRIYLNPDCGLRTRTWDVAYAKLQSVVEGAKLARQSL